MKVFNITNSLRFIVVSRMSLFDDNYKFDQHLELIMNIVQQQRSNSDSNISHSSKFYIDSFYLINFSFMISSSI